MKRIFFLIFIQVWDKVSIYFFKAKLYKNMSDFPSLVIWGSICGEA